MDFLVSLALDLITSRLLNYQHNRRDGAKEQLMLGIPRRLPPGMYDLITPCLLRDCFYLKWLQVTNYLTLLDNKKQQINKKLQPIIRTIRQGQKNSHFFTVLLNGALLRFME